MNYQKHYEMLIVTRAQLDRNKKAGFYESHHIIPKSAGGTDEAENLILLTPREHFIAHVLLWKCNPNIRKFRDPVLFFKNKTKTSRLFEAARIEHIKFMRTNNPSLTLSAEAKQSKSDKLKKYEKTQSHRQKLSEAAKGKKKRLGAVLSGETKLKIANSLKSHFKDTPMPAEVREKLSKAMTGKKFDDAFKEKCRNSAKNRIKQKCPHCDSDKMYDGGNLVLHIKRKHTINLKEI